MGRKGNKATVWGMEKFWSMTLDIDIDTYIYIYMCTVVIAYLYSGVVFNAR